MKNRASLVTRTSGFPILQIALDFIDLHRALTVAREAVAAGADWIEAGTPLIKSEGLNAIRELRAVAPRPRKIVADMKTMDVGRLEVEIAAKAGADIVGVLGVSSDATIREAVAAARNYGCEVMVDLLGVEHPAERARFAQEVGAAYVGVHIPIDDQMRGRTPLEVVRAVRRAVHIPVAVAGGIHPGNAGDVLRVGADILVVGGAITKAEDVGTAVHRMRATMRTRRNVPGDLYRRGASDADIRALLQRVSCANISDAMHRAWPLSGIRPIAPEMRCAGPVFTVRTAPGDWAKPVEAIDAARPGDVLVIDAGGVPPAVWGELATISAHRRGLAGVVVRGAVRDTADIRRIGFPVFAAAGCPHAGEPRGHGELAVTLFFDGFTVSHGDWIAADADGVMAIPAVTAVEMVNRAMDVLERENRIRAEIRRGSTLARVANTLRWEKR